MEKIIEIENHKEMSREKKLAAQREHFIRIPAAHAAGVCSVSFDPKFNIILTGARDGSMRIWSAEGRCGGEFNYNYFVTLQLNPS